MALLQEKHMGQMVSAQREPFSFELHKNRLEDLCSFSWRLSQDCEEYGQYWAFLAGPLSELHVQFKKAIDFVENGLLENTMHDQLMNVTDCAYGTLFDIEHQMKEYAGHSEPVRIDLDQYLAQGQELQRWNTVISAHTTALSFLNTGFMRIQDTLLRQKFDLYIDDVRTHGTSVTSEVLTYVTAEEGESDAAWHLLFQDLRAMGIADRYLHRKRPLLVQWFKSALEKGDLVTPTETDVPGELENPGENSSGSSTGHGDDDTGDLSRACMSAIARDDQTHLSNLMQSARVTQIDVLNGLHPLHHAARNGSVQVLAYLCRYISHVDMLDHNGDTPLKCALDHGRHDAARLLIENHADIELRTGHSERTLLHAAASIGDEDFVGLLLSAGADSSARDNAGCTPLHVAAWQGQISIVRQLCDASASVLAEDFTGATPCDMVRLSPAPDEVRETIIGLLLDKVPQNEELFENPQLRADAVQFMLLESIFDPRGEETMYQIELQGGDMQALVPKQFPMNQLAEDLFESVFQL